jgi:hypothetical protein
MVPEAWLHALVLLWLLVLSWWDLQWEEVPHWGSTAPLLLLGLLRTIDPPAPPGPALWMARGALVLLLAAMILSDNPPLAPLYSLAAVGLALQSGPEMRVLTLTWAAALLLTLGGLWSAGDAKVTMILVALWPSPYLVGALAGASLLGGLGVLLRRYRSPVKVAGVLWGVAGDLLRLRFPARQSETETAALTYAPGVPWLALGAACYLLWMVGL